MSDLKEKAKTLPQIEKEYLDFEYQKEDIISRQKQRDKFNKIKWVRLEDAQKEIDKLKQKLQQLIDELGHRPSELGTLYSTYQEGWLDAMGLAIQKFEELLEEEKMPP